MSASASIRPYRAPDHGACAALFERVMVETFQDDDPTTFAATAFAARTEGETILVAEVDEEIVGLVSFWPAGPFVHYLLILPDWRRQGIGTALMRAATRNAGGPVDLKCRADNSQARHFYAALGWREVGRGLDADEPYIRYRRSA